MLENDGRSWIQRLRFMSVKVNGAWEQWGKFH